MAQTISIAGVTGRMGTTTLAMQLVHFLKANEYSACYVEMSRQDYIWGVASVYEGVTMDKATGRTTFSGIDMYGKDRFKALLEGKTGDYDFIICDHGSITAKNYEKKAYAGGDCCIMLCGNKPNETFKTRDMLADGIYADAITVFNFTDPADQPEILGMMMGRASSTKFMPYIPDPFNYQKDYTRDTFFQELMDLAVTVMEG